MSIGRDVLESHVQRLQSRIGTHGPEITRRIEAGALIKFARATGQTDPWFVDEVAALSSIYGGLIAAPTYVSTFSGDTLSELIDLDLPLGMFLHTEDAVEQFEVIRPGMTVHARAVYHNAYLKEGRRGLMLFQEALMDLTSEGRCLARLMVGAVSFD